MVDRFGLCRKGGDFPFMFRRQTHSFPASECIGLEIADMTHGLTQIQVAEPRESEPFPAITVRNPIERGIPSLLLHDVPPVRQPQLGSSITPIVHEIQKLSIGHKAVAQFEVAEPDEVGWFLVIVGKASSAKPDVISPGRKGGKVFSRGTGCPISGNIWGRAVNWIRGTLRQDRLNIGDQQFLMLLLVMDAELD